MKNMQIFSATNGIRLAKPLPSRKQKLLQRRSLLLREIALPTWPNFGIPKASWLQQPSRWELIYRNCGVQVIPGTNSCQTRFKQSERKVFKYSTNFSSTNSKESQSQIMQLDYQKSTDSMTRERRLMVQPCFFVGNLMMAATPVFSSWWKP